MISDIFNFLLTNKEAIGAIVAILEGIVTLINLWRQFRKSGTKSFATVTFAARLKWALNPINLLRDPIV